MQTNLSEQHIVNFRVQHFSPKYWQTSDLTIQNVGVTTEQHSFNPDDYSSDAIYSEQCLNITHSGPRQYVRVITQFLSATSWPSIPFG